MKLKLAIASVFGLVFTALVFVTGFCYGTWVGALGEMSAYETLFSGNLITLRICGKVQCAPNVLANVVATNQMALVNYESLEKLHDANWLWANLGFGLRGYVMASRDSHRRSTDHWHALFAEATPKKTTAE